MASVDGGAMRSHLVVLDGFVGVFIILLSSKLALSVEATPRYFGPVWLAWLLAVGIGLPVIVRRLWPRIAAAVVITSAFASALVHFSLLATVSVGLVLYTIAMVERARLSLPVLAVGILAGSGPWTNLTPALGLFTSLLTLLPWLLGRGSHLRLRDDAKRAEEREERVALAERLRIARDLHDIISHSMSLIAVKAGVANHVADTRPDEAKAALAVIETTSRDALADLRRMLGVLRASGIAEAQLRPALGLSELSGLAQWAETAGVTVQLEVAELELPDGMQQAVYRIVQEALTNVVRHSGAGHCQVRLHAEGPEVVIEVSDPGGRGAVDRSGSGHGLVGMRERVAAYGGKLNTGRLPGGGFGVCARLPLDGSG